MKTLQYNVTEDSHLFDAIDNRLGDSEELDNYTYTELLTPIMFSTEQGTLNNGSTYREVLLNGVSYGIGYTTVNNTVIVTTVLNAYMLEQNRDRGLVQTVVAFN